MQVYQQVLLVLFIICSVILIFLILIQSGKGGSLGIMGGGSSSSAFGSSTVDVVTKATWWVATIFLVLAILSAVAFAQASLKVPVPEDQSSEAAPLDGGATPGTPDSAPGQNSPAKPATPPAPGR